MKKKKKSIRKSIIGILALFIVIFVTLPAYAQDPAIDSPSVILIDSSTGRILFDKNSHDKMYPASTTKIMTAILALEKGNLSDMVTANSHAVLDVGEDSSGMGLVPGEQISLENLLYGLLVNSANESANVIAEHISGNISDFVALMNQRASELGAQNTHFANPNGLHDDNHYTSAYDLALFARHAMTIPKFRDIVKTITYEVPPTDKVNHVRYLSNTNQLLNYYKGRRYLYDGALGIKTGYTSNAGHTLVAAASRNGMELIAVIMGSRLEGVKNYSYEDATSLLDYGFNAFSNQNIVQQGVIIDEASVQNAKENSHVILQTDQPLSALLSKDADKKLITKTVTKIPDIKAPITKGEVLGTVTYKYQDQVLGTVNLTAERDVEKDPVLAVVHQTISVFNILWVQVATGAIGLIFVIYLLVQLVSNRKRRRQRRFGQYGSGLSYINEKRR